MLKGALALLERIKNAVHDVRLNSNSRIVHPNGEQLRLRIGRGNRDLAAFGGELDCILNQVPNNLLKLRRVGHDVVRAGPQADVQL